MPLSRKNVRIHILFYIYEVENLWSQEKNGGDPSKEVAHIFIKAITSKNTENYYFVDRNRMKLVKGVL